MTSLNLKKVRTLASVLAFFIVASAVTSFHPSLMLFSQAMAVSEDDTPPNVQITYPMFCNDPVATGNITVEGTAFDESGIQKVEAFAHSYPFNNASPFEMAVPVAPGDWSRWSIQISIPDDRLHRILVRAIDNAGNEEWAENLVNTDRAKQIQETTKIDNQNNRRIAFVDSTFTNAAYNLDSFYDFYYKYASTPDGVDITRDLNLMTGDIPMEPDNLYMIPLLELVEKFAPDSKVSIIGDENVHNGQIFTDDGKNVYSALFLFHNEYVTQEEYDNLRLFVSNGGTIVLIDGNIFFAEITYDKENCTVTLVKGHNWEFDGKAVRKSVWERYLDENKEWVGSNFINNAISDPVVFENNPFNYQHFEENEVVNPNAKILLDYGVKFKVEEDPKNPFVFGGIFQGKPKTDEYDDLGKRVATYELDHGKGKVIMLGIYGQNLVNNTSFLDFFDRLILPRSLGEKYDLTIDEGTYQLYWGLQDGEVSKIDLDKEMKSLILTLDMDDQEPTSTMNYLMIVIPKQLIDADTPTKQAGFSVFVDGQQVSYEQHYNDIERGLVIPVTTDSTQVKIIGTQVVPEFSLAVIGAVFGLSILLVVVRRLYTINTQERLKI